MNDKTSCTVCVHHKCFQCKEYDQFTPKEDPESLSNQMKLLRMDYVNTHTDIDIIKKRLHNMQNTLREILKRVSL